MSETAAPTGFRRGLLLTSSGDIVSLGLLFLETMIVVRLLPTDVYGAYILLLSTTNFLVMAIDLGCKVSVTQLISSGNPEQQRRVVASALIFRAAVAGAASVLILLFQMALSILSPSTEWVQWIGYLPLMLVPASFDELLFGMLQGFKAYRPMAIARSTRSLLRIVMTVVLLVVFHAGVAALVYSWCVTFLLASAFELWAMPVRDIRIWHRPTVVDILRFGFPLQMTRFLDFLATRMQILLVGALSGVDGVALYAVATRIPDALLTLVDSFSRVYFPTMTTLLATGQRRTAEALLSRSLGLASFAGGLAAVGAIVFRDEIIGLLFSPRYLSSAPAFALLMLSLHMTILLNILGYTLTAAGRPGRSLGVDVVRTLVIAVGDVLVIPIAGFIGAAVAVLAGGYVSTPAAAWLLRRNQLPVDIAPAAKHTCIVLFCTGLSWLIPQGDLAFVLLAKAAIVGLFIVLGLWALGISRGDLTDAMRQQTRRWRPTGIRSDEATEWST